MKNPEGRILIVDDDKDVCESLRMFLKYEFEEVFTLTNPNLLLQWIKKEQIDVVLLDMNYKAGIQTGNEGIYWIRKILKTDPEIVPVLITAYGDIELAIKAIKEGAFDFVVKPWDNDKLLSTLKAAYKLRETKIELKNLKEKHQQIYNDIDKKYKIIWGSSPAMQKIFEVIRKVAPTEANILIVGENGTGKELIAREIRRLSARSNEAFVHVDLGAISENLFESELFGHVKGAFTDAFEDRAGRFEIANEGTLFLDEIGNLPVYLQSKLLYSMQNKVVTRLGSNKQIPLDVRLIFATNKDLDKMISENLFRKDLMYRINTIQIEIPPLRKRKEDIGQLADYYLNHFATKYGKSHLKINEKAIEKLKTHSWPGNIRELKHSIEKAVILCDSMILSPVDFIFSQADRDFVNPEKSLRFTDLEKNAIIEALDKNDMNLSETARELGISRPTLYNKICKYGLKL